MPPTTPSDEWLEVLTATGSATVHVQRGVRAPMRDGIELDADVFRPEAEVDLPVALMRLPYGKRIWQAQGVPRPEQVAAAGYIVAVQDVRGRFESDGVFDPPDQEALDGYDSVQWAAALPGSNGRVAMYGPSYLAHVQWAAALERPPALVSILPMVSPNDSQMDGYGFRGGAIELGGHISWAVGAIGFDELARRSGMTPEVAEGMIAERMQRLATRQLPATRPLRELANDPTFLGRAVRSWGSTWQRVAQAATMTRGRYSEIHVPVFLIGGWFDGFLGSTLAQYQGLRAAGTADPLHLVIGPWSHMEAGSKLGDADFGPSGAHDHMGGDLSLEQQHIRWFEATLSGRSDALSEIAPVRLFVMGENQWMSFETFPPRTEPIDFYLISGGSLSRSPEADASTVTYTYDPSDPVPTIGGATLMEDPPGPIDQRALYGREDVVGFTSPPLEAPVTVVGYIEVTLFASTDAPDTDFVVRLCDLMPDGRSLPIADGIIRASARDRYDHLGWTGETNTAEPLSEDGAEFRFNLWATAHTFLTGHQIRIDVTSSCFPRWDPNLNTGIGAWDGIEPRKAVQTIHLGGVRATRIRLPVLENRTTNQPVMEHKDED